MLTLLLPTTPTDLLNWLVQSTLALGAGWAFYYLALRRERCFHYNRRFLLLTPWLVLALPVLLEVAAPALTGLLPRWGVLAGSSLLAGGLLPTVRITATGTRPELSDVYLLAWLPLLYLLVTLALLARLGLQVLQLWLTTRRWPRQKHPDYILVLTGGQRPVSSFGRWVFWDETASLTSAEAEVVLAHEVAHVQQRHTRQRLLLEVARALLWPCPFVHLYPRALETTHEFLADSAALAPSAAATPTAAAELYAALLARLALRQFHPTLPLTHSFTQSLILTRIRMLTSQSPIRRWKQWLALPLGAVLLLTVACEKATSPANPATAAQDNMPAPPPSPLAEEAPAPPLPPAYTYVEQMPEYAGGSKQLLADIGKLAQYPAVAKAEKLGGRVFITFIVAADGSLQNIYIREAIQGQVKDFGADGEQMVATLTTPAAQALNEVALNAVRNLPGRWQPGRQDGKAVAVLYTVPITFTP
ncbi:M56 family metallopeptidase [Hymenobacter sublimis]|uniref:M56 family metallopeptidase n=1 Tax=Hymenobacter sublimis TaxID=2933777 RepID=A0ABY4J916_9BACT|nr:M56 family metallopeptidase [Hymenobacter sublimis]UPL49295.1 M56 family metallopeptidase [Hymenobacter sublimis]